MNSALLPFGEVDIQALSGLFESTTNSYKLVFFQAIVNLLQSRPQATGSLLLETQDLAVEMAALAWYPHVFYRLSFGSQDHMGKVLDKLRFSVDERAIVHADTQKRLRRAIREQYCQIGLQDLLRYVPYRLLTPFFLERLRGTRDHQVNQLVRQWSAEAYATETPVLYRFVEISSPAIELHPSWVAYLKQSLPIVIGWVRKHWIDYLQLRNPNTPSIPSKVNPPLTRAPLTMQTAYWRAIICKTPLRCLYSKENLDPRKFALDHFIPWSFVCHDQIWNLIPVSPKSNSAKRNRLPSKSYLERFIELQSEGLSISRTIFDDKRWRKLTEPFVSDLRIASEELLDAKSLRAAYNGVLPAMMSLAERTGFSAGWKN